MGTDPLLPVCCTQPEPMGSKTRWLLTRAVDSKKGQTPFGVRPMKTKAPSTTLGVFVSIVRYLAELV
ncbi:MAG: hypothetical protein HLUCCX14_10215 [Marinobacter excellens HL-55]|uniref:Uncharacterized protein n=1 Tax=Marinobacter excellens HL-55 TaxID=1305731 RepID=A0A0P7ZGM1_9GAMM|nr:MAG: hypothetical protein HLUCCX14_10215 [Marinobacter excellens HL-55]